jgi:hypothetical protein
MTPTEIEGLVSRLREAATNARKYQADGEVVEPQPLLLDMLDQAADALSQTIPRTTDEGMVLVPREPTQAMINAYCETQERLGIRAWANASVIWPAMIEAAPHRVSKTDEALKTDEGRNAVIEECARVAETIFGNGQRDWEIDQQLAGEKVAAAIRALSHSPPPNTESWK